MATLGALLVLAVRRSEDPAPVAKRFVEQFAMLVPRMLCALIAAGFVAELLPKEAIGRMLGSEAGLWAIPIAAATGLLVPAGPVIAFAIAAVFAKSGASTAALVTFITSWSIYAAHRILIYEIPLLGPSFLRLRATAAFPVPFLAGAMAYVVALLVGFMTLIPPH
jgi:uncharacterized membrane protein YraQ (UPF0718 family)